MTDLIVVPSVLGGEKTTQAAEDTVVIHDRPIPPEVEQRLREISPISDRHSWLAIRWMAEFQRWVIYECVPNGFIEESFRAELEGPDPDTLEDWNRICSKYQWDMYRKFRVHARPFWVVQGASGGHKCDFDPVDKELLRAQGLPIEPPKPGALPYAPVDERVFRQLIARNKLVQVKNDLAEFKRRWGNTPGFKRSYANQLRDARTQYVSFVNAQFQDGDDELRAAYSKGELDDAPRTEDDFVEKDERADQNYIDHGRF